MKMSIERIIRMLAGSLVLISLLLAHVHSRNWLWLTAFVGFNLFQSAFTNFCPPEMLLRKLGVGTGACTAREELKADRSCCTK